MGEPEEYELEIGEVVPAERRLAETRAEIEDMLLPPTDEFPRSETMRFLMGRSGKAAAVGAVAILFALKPRLAMTLLRFLPAGRFVPRIF